MFSVVRAAAVSTQRRVKHIFMATNPDTRIELCFLGGPRSDAVTGTV
jgi:hypothetical protein